MPPFSHGVHTDCEIIGREREPQTKQHHHLHVLCGGDNQTWPSFRVTEKRAAQVNQVVQKTGHRPRVYTLHFDIFWTYGVMHNMVYSEQSLLLLGALSLPAVSSVYVNVSLYHCCCCTGAYMPFGVWILILLIQSKCMYHSPLLLLYRQAQSSANICIIHIYDMYVW